MTAISDDFKYLLTALAEQTGLDELGLDENGACALQFDDRITVYLVELEKEAAIRLVSDLGTPSPDVEGAAFQRCLLEANWLGTGTHGATLSLEPETGSVCLWRQASLAAFNPMSFTDLVGQFVDTAEAWTALIRGEALPNPADRVSTLGHPVGIPA